MVEAQLNYPTGVVNVNTTPGVGIVEQIQPLSEETSSTLHIDENWNNLVFSIVGTERLFKLPGRIDLLNDRIELKDAGTIKSIQGQLLGNVLMESPGQRSRYFVRNASFKNGADIPTGFYEVMNEGEINVLKFFGYLVLEPSYNPALDVGNRGSEIREMTELYLMRNDHVKILPKRKKDIFEILGNLSENIAKSRSLNPKDELGLIAIVEELNNN